MRRIQHGQLCRMKSANATYRPEVAAREATRPSSPALVDFYRMAREMVSTVAALVRLVFVGSVATAQERIPPTEWKEYKYPEAGFAITFPYEPVPHSDSVNEGATIYTIRFGPDSALSIRSKAAPYCSSEMRIAMEKMGSKPQGFRSLKMAGHDAWEWEEKATDRWSYTRLWCGDRSAFSASLSWPLRLSKPAAAVRILDSFRDISPSTR